MRDRRLVNTQELGDRGVRVACVGLPANESSQVHRRETVPLLVLGDLRVGVGGCLANEDRHLGKAGPPRGATALGAVMDTVASGCVGRQDDERLQDAVLADAVGQLVDLRFRKLCARIVRVFDQPIERYEQSTPGADFIFGRGLRRARRCGLSRGSRRRARTNFAWLCGISVEKLELVALRFSPRQQAHRAIVPLSCRSWQKPQTPCIRLFQVPCRPA